MDIKGDIKVYRTGVFDKRADEGLLSEVITASYTVLRHSAKWLRLSAAASQDVALPDATTCPNGWAVVIHASGAANLAVNYDGATLLKSVVAGAVYIFTLLDNSTSDGVWHLNYLEDATSTTAARYVHTFNATTDWGSAAGGYYTLNLAESVHGRQADPMWQVFEMADSKESKVICDQEYNNAAGDIALNIVEDSDARFAGKIVII